jgi:hypothetical protein
LYLEWKSVPTRVSGAIRIEYCVPACETIMLWGGEPKNSEEWRMYFSSMFVVVDAIG